MYDLTSSKGEVGITKKNMKKALLFRRFLRNNKLANNNKNKYLKK